MKTDPTYFVYLENCDVACEEDVTKESVANMLGVVRLKWEQNEESNEGSLKGKFSNYVLLKASVEEYILY